MNNFKRENLKMGRPKIETVAKDLKKLGKMHDELASICAPAVHQAFQSYIMVSSLRDVLISNPVIKKPKPDGTIIALEGLNCCGKSTQKQLLKDKLNEKGYSVYLVPTYQSACWDIMSKIGKGTFLVNEPLEDTVIWSTYFIDQFAASEKDIYTADFIIFDRYLDNFRFTQRAVMEVYNLKVYPLPVQ